MKEQAIIDHISLSLHFKERYFVNVHGSSYSSNGTPDIITSDKDGHFLAIEAKAPGSQPRANQWLHAIRILKSKNNSRSIIAYEDFDIDDVDNYQLPILYVGDEIGQSEFDAMLNKLKVTTEIKLH